MNIPGLVFSILAIISGILWFIFFGSSTIMTGEKITILRILNITYNILLSFVAGICGIKISIKETRKFGIKIFIIVSGIILIIAGRIICGMLLIIAGGLLIFKTLNLKRKFTKAE